MPGGPNLQSSTAPTRRYPAPLSARRASAVVEMLRLPPAGRVLDLAAGTGGLLLDALAANDARGLGLVAREADAIALRAIAAAEGLSGRVEFRVATADCVPAQRFDAALCVRSAGAPADSLELDAAQCLGWLRVGGTLVVGEPFLRRPPAPRYRELLGESAAGLKTVGATARAVVALGYELAVTAVLSETEWDAHESANYRARLEDAAACADVQRGARLRERADAWYHAYWAYGRDTLGFAFHAFRKARVLEVLASA